ncbi:MAG: radical SAM protein [Bacteroidetes bacterium]|nr:radical SAM protein [Bacteroidota bacterium]
MIGSHIRNSIKGWYFIAKELQESVATGQMLNPSIDLSNACNLNCPYCYIEEKNSIRKHRKANELSFEETLKVIDELADCGARTINLVGAGEPTVDQHFGDIVKHIHSKGITTVLFTNGILLANKPDKIDFLFKHDVSVILKYNAISSEIQDLVAGKKGYSDQRNMALQMLIERNFNKEQPTRLGIDIIAFSGNVKDIPQIHQWCRENNIFPIAGDYIPTGRTDNGVFLGDKTVLNLTEEETQKAFDLLQPINSEERFWLIKELDSIDNKFGIQRDGCFAYFGGAICTQAFGIYVDIEGKVWPCIARKKKINGQLQNGLLGNVRNNDSVKKIWEENIYIKSMKKNFDGGCPYKPVLKFNNSNF